jgi:hypothetical protein
MKKSCAPISAVCNKQIIIAADEAVASNGVVLCAWGRHCTQARRNELLSLLAGWPLKCLGVNADGSPVHPLYKAYSTPLVGFP